MNLAFLITSALFFVYSLRFSYFWWFQSKDYVTMNRRKRREYRKKIFFMPQILLFDYYDQNPQFEIWINRSIGLVFIAASILGIVTAIHGPFTIR
jgi:hypothetical protein